MGRRGEHSAEEYRNMILNAAEKIITEEGIARLTARHLTSEIGYTAGSLYLVFQNLDDIIAQSNERTLTHLHDAIQQATANIEAPIEKIQSAAYTYMLFAIANPHRWRLIFDHRPAKNEVDLSGTKKRLKMILALFEAPIEKLNVGQKSFFHTKTLWSALHGVIALALSEKIETLNTAELKSQLETLIENYLNSL